MPVDVARQLGVESVIVVDVEDKETGKTHVRCTCRGGELCRLHRGGRSGLLETDNAGGPTQPQGPLKHKRLVVVTDLLCYCIMCPVQGGAIWLPMGVASAGGGCCGTAGALCPAGGPRAYASPRE
jgi:hypothetical protein